MIRWLAPRRWRQLLLTVVVAVLFVAAASAAVQYRNRPRVDITFTGAIAGRMTDVTSVGGHGTSCTIGRVQGNDQWDGTFVGMVAGKAREVSIAITPYHGRGTYLSSGFPDPAGLASLSLAQLYQLKTSVHMAVWHVPPRQNGSPDYGTEPFPASRPTSVDQLKPLAGLGHASVRLNSDQKSGVIDATLMNAMTPSDQPVRLKGSFRCSTVGS